MEIQEAKAYVNRQVELTWTDRKGNVIHDTVQIFSVGFVPLYGPCLQTNRGDIRLDRVSECAFCAERRTG